MSYPPQPPQDRVQPRQWVQPPPPPPPQGQPYVIPPRPFNHGVHFMVDLFTLGLWVPFHVLIWALHPRKSTIVYPDGRRERR